MDLHTGTSYVMDKPYGHTLDPYNDESLYKSFEDLDYLPLHLDCLERVLLYTAERVEIPEGYVGLVQLRSTFARMGLIVPATYADPGFKGTLTMEVFNSNTNPIVIHPGMHMWNLVIVPAPFEETYKGRYQAQGTYVVLPKAIAEGT